MTAPAPLDTARIEMIRSLDTKGDSLLGQLVEVFGSESTKTMDDLRRADELGDRMALLRGAHRLRGSAATMGAPALAFACERLEVSAAGETVAPSALSPLVTEIERELERAIGAFAEAVAASGEGPESGSFVVPAQPVAATKMP